MEECRSKGNGCVSVGRAVASDTEVLGSEPVFGKFFMYLLSTVCKDENKEKESGNGIFNKII